MSKLPAKIPHKRKPGRPKGGAYRTEFCEQLVDHMAKGYAYEAFAHKIGVITDTLHDWEKRYPEWMEAKKRAFAANFYFWEHKLITSIEHGTPFNMAAYIFSMKTRFKIGLETNHKTVVQVKNETNVNSQGDPQLVSEFKDIIAAYVDERKDTARKID